MAGHLERFSPRRLAGLAAVFGIALLLFVGAAPAGAGETYPNTDPPEDTQVQRATLEQELPRTGSNIAPIAITGVVLVGMGGGLVYLTRRRNHEDAALSA
jgi:LPXTG-motif cell wall-anchored protein